MSKNLKIFSRLVLLVLTTLACNTTHPPPPGEKPTLNLILEDVSCIEAWITLTTTNLQLPATITLKQNDETKSTIILCKADTLLYVDSLLPNTNYTFQVSSILHKESSNEVTTTTHDTISHNFTFETWTFGYGITQSIFMTLQ